MRLQIQHFTNFTYSLPARSNINEVRLSPEENARQKPLESKILVEPNPETGLKVSRDLFGNQVHAFEVEQKHVELKIDARIEVETADDEKSVAECQRVEVGDFSAVKTDDELHSFLVDSQYVKKCPEIWREALDHFHSCSQTRGSCVEVLSQHIFATCEWTEYLIHRATTAEEVFHSRQGTCQDFSHLLIGYCRALGIPAKYISGYLYDPGLEDESILPEFVGAHVSHAWVEFYTPGVGWVGIDPTNKRWVDQNYVSVAKGRDYGDVAPVRGSLLGGGDKRSLDVEVKVNRVG